MTAEYTLECSDCTWTRSIVELGEIAVPSPEERAEIASDHHERICGGKVTIVHG